MNRPGCEATRKDRQPCRAPALPDSALCWTHDPRQAEAAAAARLAGASKGGKLRALQGRRLRLDTPRAVVKFSSGLVQDCLAKTVDVDIARAVFYGLSVQLKALELAEASEVRRLLAEVEALTRQVRRA